MPSKSNLLQKNLLASPLPRLFLLCQSRYVLFLLGAEHFCSCCTEDIAGTVPTLKNSSLSIIYDFHFMIVRVFAMKTVPVLPVGGCDKSAR
jgi:hypothetical protein